MAIDAYLKVAAGQLRRAASALQQEHEDTRRAINDKEHETRSTIAELQVRSKFMRAELSPNLSPQQRDIKVREIRGIDQKISDVQHQTEQQRNEKLGKIQELEHEINYLITKANELEKQT
jgi:hypothetical protein